MTTTPKTETERVIDLAEQMAFEAARVVIAVTLDLDVNAEAEQMAFEAARVVIELAEGSPLTSTVASAVKLKTDFIAAVDALAAPNKALAEVARLVANIGEYREVVDSMAACLRPHERPAFVRLYREQAKAALAVTGPQDPEAPTSAELEDFRRRHWSHWNAADNLLIAHLVAKLALQESPK